MSPLGKKWVIGLRIWTQAYSSCLLLFHCATFLVSALVRKLYSDSDTLFGERVSSPKKREYYNFFFLLWQTKPFQFAVIQCAASFLSFQLQSNRSFFFRVWNALLGIHNAIWYFVKTDMNHNTLDLRALAFSGSLSLCACPSSPLLFSPLQATFSSSYYLLFAPAAVRFWMHLSPFLHPLSHPSCSLDEQNCFGMQCNKFLRCLDIANSLFFICFPAKGSGWTGWAK